MPDWEERISTGSDPALLLEHELRYRAAAPIVSTGDVWCDLGCGFGLAAAAGAGSFDGRLVLVDKDADAVHEAARRFEGANTVSLVADLSSAADLAPIREAVLPASGGCITCFETIEHLKNFAPVIELMLELCEDEGFTAILSIPNDAFWSIRNPHHETMWGESAFAELQSLLPETCVLAHQVALGGSWIARGPDELTLSAELVDDQSPTHLLAAFGVRAELLGAPARVSVVDLDSRRQWESQREADLAYFKTLAEHRE